jgi:hypothetical protein
MGYYCVSFAHSTTSLIHYMALENNTCMSSFTKFYFCDNKGHSLQDMYSAYNIEPTLSPVSL